MPPPPPTMGNPNYHFISRTKTYLKWSKRPINKHWVTFKAKQNSNSKLFKEEKIIQERKNVSMICKDLVSWVARKQEFDQSNYIL